MYKNSINGIPYEMKVKIVVEIPEQMYLNAKADTLCGADILVSAIKNGTPVKEGYWRAVYQGDEIINYRCSECDFGNTFGKSTYRMNYCPNCGCRMIEQKESEE